MIDFLIHFFSLFFLSIACLLAWECWLAKERKAKSKKRSIESCKIFDDDDDFWANSSNFLFFLPISLLLLLLQTLNNGQLGCRPSKIKRKKKSSKRTLSSARLTKQPAVELVEAKKTLLFKWAAAARVFLAKRKSLKCKRERNSSTKNKLARVARKLFQLETSEIHLVLWKLWRALSNWIARASSKRKRFSYISKLLLFLSFSFSTFSSFWFFRLVI